MEGFFPFLLILLLIFSFLLSLSRKALASFSYSRLEERLTDKKRRDRLMALLDKKEKLLESIYFLKLISYLLLTLLISSRVGLQAGKLVQERIALGFLLSAGIILLFLEAIPKAAVRKSPDAILQIALPVMSFLHSVFFPLWFFLETFENLIIRVLGGSKIESPAEKVEEEILSAVEEGEREGVIHEEEKEMIESIIEFKDAEVSEIMVPRTDMVSLDMEISIIDAIKVAIEKGHSRLPVHKKNQDNVIGILYVKDLLSHMVHINQAEPLFANVQLKDILRKPHFVPETKKIGDLLREFQNNKFHIAIVLDEFGGTSGIITIEDILEEIVGEIEDEYDASVAEGFRKIETGVAEVDARTHVDTLNEEMGLHLPEGNGFDTVGGFVFSTLGKVPKTGEHFTFEGVEFYVLEADERKIKKLKVMIQQPSKEDEK